MYFALSAAIAAAGAEGVWGGGVAVCSGFISRVGASDFGVASFVADSAGASAALGSPAGGVASCDADSAGVEAGADPAPPLAPPAGVAPGAAFSLAPHPS